MRWEDVPEYMDAWVEKVAAPAWDIRQAVSRIVTLADIGCYYHPYVEKAAVYSADAHPSDLELVKWAMQTAVGTQGVREAPLTYGELAHPEGQWIKVAYSPTLRTLGEYLNFFPGQYPGDIPNHASPLAAMLTSGILGAGLGWAGGKLAQRFLPEEYGERLGRSGALLGAALGAAPGALWAFTNLTTGKRWNDPSLLAGHPAPPPADYRPWLYGTNKLLPYTTTGTPAVAADKSVLGDYVPKEVTEYLKEVQHHAESHGMHFENKAPGLPVKQQRKKHASVRELSDWLLEEVPLGQRYRRALEKTANAFNPAWNANFGTLGQLPVSVAPTPIDVNINALGQTLWNTGASPQLTAATMGTMYAAQQLPDPRSQPGWVTGNQLGQLAANAAGDYLTGLLAGFAINQVIGTPLSNSTFGAANAALGVIGSVVPKLLGK